MYLLDTHIILWWLENPKQLKKEAREIISARRNPVIVSAVSIWEMTIKASLGKLTLPENPAPLLREEGFSLLLVSAEHAWAVHELPAHHKDPFDRLLIAQAIKENLQIITRDKQFCLYQVRITEG
jgi:PIN domain nuclease of toxin-antitoxin system